MDEPTFKEKARRHMFNCHLKDFPVVFQMYVRAFDIQVESVDTTMADIIGIIRTSENGQTAYTMVCHYLDGLE